MNLHSIVKKLQIAQGIICKQDILENNKGNEELKNYLKLVYDPSINYYQTKITVPKDYKNIYGNEDFSDCLPACLAKISSREVSGVEAQEYLFKLWKNLNQEGRNLLELLISRSIGAGIADTTVLKVFPQLFLQCLISGAR